jgi:alpha/beta superfamily hydrolase
MEALTFTTEDGVRLEGELREPDEAARGIAVLCHPHPRHGGSKDHPLLWAIRNDLAAARGFAVLGFNFRGVMGSQGSYGGGRDELRDVRAAISTLRERTGDALPVLVVGWSFGASVALRAALDDRRIGAVALVGMPLRPGDLSLPPLPEAADLRALRRPALLVAGEHDGYCPADELRDYAAAFPDANVTIVPGTDHYFWRREREAAEAVGTFATARLLDAAER